VRSLGFGGLAHFLLLEGGRSVGWLRVPGQSGVAVSRIWGSWRLLLGGGRWLDL
jgi:hypothetical protein